MVLSREQMLAALFARRMQYNAQENDCSIQQAILDDLEPYDEGEDTHDIWEFYCLGEKVMQAYVYSLSETIFHWDVPETDEWARKAGAPSYCTAYCRLPFGELEGRRTWQFAFFAPIQYDERERQRWQKIEQLRLIKATIFHLVMRVAGGDLVTVDSLDGQIYLLWYRGPTGFTSFTASRYNMAEEIVKLELQGGSTFETLETDIDTEGEE